MLAGSRERVGPCTSGPCPLDVPDSGTPPDEQPPNNITASTAAADECAPLTMATSPENKLNINTRPPTGTRPRRLDRSSVGPGQWCPGQAADALNVRATYTPTGYRQTVPARAAGEFVPYDFVALAGFGLLHRAQLAQRLELIGAGCDPGGFARLGFPGGGGRSFGGELLLNDGVGAGVVDGARGAVGEQLVDALPLRELRPAAFVVGQVLVPRVLPRVEPGVGRYPKAG